MSKDTHKIPYINNKGELGYKKGKGDGNESLVMKNNSSTRIKDSDLTDKKNNSPKGFGPGITPLDADKITTNKYDFQKDRITEYNSKSIDYIMNKLHTSLHLPDSLTSSSTSILDNDVTYYNRFKAANPNIQLDKAFSHVFFVAPSCNILDLSKSGDNYKLQGQYSGYQLFEYAYKANPQLLHQISAVNNRSNDFMMLLSNYVSGFPLSDEYIDTDTYGKGYTGWKIAFGKNNIGSRTANSIEVSFYDDKKLHIYHLHRLWVEYISDVYRGIIAPTNTNLIQKVLDYAGAIYYFLTAEDNETILFWCKYYGVFPSTIPSTPYSYSKGSIINNPEVSITYNYSFKKEFDPYIFTEFNYNAGSIVKSSTRQIKYAPTYDKYVGSVGKTYVGTPFVDLVSNNATGKYCYKLRFYDKNRS